MRYAILIAGLAALIAACGGGGDSIPNELRDICTQRGEAATDDIQVTSPESGDEVRSPLTFAGSVTVDEPILYFSIVAADGSHIADYPGRPDRTGTPIPFQQDVPFGVEEETPACLWVSKQNVEDPQDAIRIPITLLPGGTR